jgi:hypothetical protein
VAAISGVLTLSAGISQINGQEEFQSTVSKRYIIGVRKDQRSEGRNTLNGFWTQINEKKYCCNVVYVQTRNRCEDKK